MCSPNPLKILSPLYPSKTLCMSLSDMGTTVHSDHQQHMKFHPSHQLYKKSLREIDIPPRKLLSRRAAALDSEIFMDSPKSMAEEAIFRKFLPYNSIDDEEEDDDSDPYTSDHFRMFEFKVRKCTRSRSHDWTDCPFAHPGEKARRRDPRRYNYSGTVCSEFRRGNCSKGDNCESAHGVFECWLHPSRYRTEACKDGKNCKRKVCFFAHTPRQLRLIPANSSYETVSSPPPPVNSQGKRHRNHNNCCVYCHSVADSPTSTLFGMTNLSPPLSPPLSPARFSPLSSRYKEAVNELMSSIEAMRVGELPNSPHGKFDNLQWVDVNFNGGEIDQQQQFVLSPSTPSPSVGFSKFNNYHQGKFNIEGNYNKNNIEDNYGFGGPDLGWVNDLLT